LENESESGGTGFEVHDFLLITSRVFDHVTELVWSVIADLNDFLIELFEIVDVGLEFIGDIKRWGSENLIVHIDLKII
jgi:hypothetical protein